MQPHSQPHSQLHFPARTALALTAAAFTLAACSPGNRNAATDSTSAVAAVRDTTAAAGAMANPGGTPAAMTDANIFGQLHQVNASEIAAGDLASTKATAAGVKQFARHMVTDHKTLDKGANDLATKLGIQPSLSDSTMMKQANDALSDLQGKTGTDFDNTYIEQQIKGHQNALQLIDNAMSTTQNAQIKQMLTDARPKVQAHLTAVQALQSNKTS